MVSTVRLCVTCKGARNLCGLGSCPLLGRFRIKPRIEHALKEDFFGSATSVFVGRHGYPNVSTGPLAPIVTEGAGMGKIDDPSKWFGTPYQDIVEMRSMLLRTKEANSVFSKGRMISDLQEIALSSRPPDVEMLLAGKPVYRVSFSDVNQPMGPTARLRKLTLTENVKVGRRVQKVVSDEMPAAEAGFELYRGGEDVYKIGTILSSGALGLEGKRKLVPTRWSITASHDIVAKRLISGIKDYSQVGECLVFTSDYLENHYEVLLMPGEWEFENFESWAPGTPWAMDAKKAEVIEEHEPYAGRTKYAELQGGGYYASRLGVTEGLTGLRRQACAVVFREVREGYTIPLGVWQVLENVRNAFRQKPEKFASREDALVAIGRRLRLPVSDYARQSVILRRRTIANFGRPVK
ncbi:MAG: Nre family DNA repair protein [Candidatus Aenigmatarchaeota archaeon]